MAQSRVEDEEQIVHLQIHNGEENEEIAGTHPEDVVQKLPEPDGTPIRISGEFVQQGEDEEEIELEMTNCVMKMWNEQQHKMHEINMRIILFAPLMYNRSTLAPKWQQWMRKLDLIIDDMSPVERKKEAFFRLDQIDHIMDCLGAHLPTMTPEDYSDAMRLLADIEKVEELKVAMEIARSSSYFSTFYENLKKRKDIEDSHEGLLLTLVTIKHYWQYVHHKVIHKKGILASLIKLNEKEEKEMNSLKDQGNDLFRRDEFHSAHEMYTKALAIGAFNHFLYGNRCETSRCMENFWDALWDARRAVTIKPKWPKGHYRYARAFYELKDIDRAICENKRGQKLCDDTGTATVDLQRQATMFNDEKRKQVSLSSKKNEVPDLLSESESDSDSDSVNPQADQGRIPSREHKLEELATADNPWRPSFKCRGPENRDEESVKTEAISEPIYSTAYAYMCQKLSTIKVQSASKPGQIVQFLPILVHNCQREFEKEQQSEIDEVERMEEIAKLPTSEQETELRILQNIIEAKNRTLGSIRFIGELYKLRILTENIVHTCTMKLLKAKDDDSLECLFHLLSNIGKDLDHEKAKKRMDQFFEKIGKIIASRKNRPRILFLMQDLLDLRKNKWIPKRQEDKPTVIVSYDVPHGRMGTAYDPSITRTTEESICLDPDRNYFDWWCRERFNASNKKQSASASLSSSQSNSAPTEAIRVSMVTDGASAAGNDLNSVNSRDDWLQVFNKGLTSLLNERPSNNQIFYWIRSNISEVKKQDSDFIRALVTGICRSAGEGEGQSCRIDPDILKLRCPVLQRYIDNKRSLELQALYAIQALARSLQHPPGLMRIVFDVMFDEEVIMEDTFYDWKKSEDPKEIADKNKALKSVTSFFTWLAEAATEFD